eukprot:1044370-Prorocentrum_lima.AAC.1
MEGVSTQVVTQDAASHVEAEALMTQIECGSPFDFSSPFEAAIYAGDSSKVFIASPPREQPRRPEPDSP